MPVIETLTIREAVEATGVSRLTILKAISRRAIPGAFVSRRRWRLPKRAFAAWLRRHYQPGRRGRPAKRRKAR